MKTEKSIIEIGYQQLSGKELEQRVSDKRVLGDYLYGYKYVGIINSDGSMEGENNVGSHHIGKWTIDTENNTFTMKWNTGWENWTGRAYAIEGTIHFFDIATGDWRTSFTEIR